MSMKRIMRTCAVPPLPSRDSDGMKRGSRRLNDISASHLTHDGSHRAPHQRRKGLSLRPHVLRASFHTRATRSQVRREGTGDWPRHASSCSRCTLRGSRMKLTKGAACNTFAKTPNGRILKRVESLISIGTVCSEKATQSPRIENLIRATISCSRS